MESARSLPALERQPRRSWPKPPLKPSRPHRRHRSNPKRVNRFMARITAEPVSSEAVVEATVAGFRRARGARPSQTHEAAAPLELADVLNEVAEPRGSTARDARPAQRYPAAAATVEDLSAVWSRPMPTPDDRHRGFSRRTQTQFGVRRQEPASLPVPRTSRPAPALAEVGSAWVEPGPTGDRSSRAAARWSRGRGSRSRPAPVAVRRRDRAS